MKWLNDTVMFACNQGGHFSQMMVLCSLFGKYTSVLVTDNERANNTLPELANLDHLEFAMGMADKRKELKGTDKAKSRWSFISAYLKLTLQCFSIWLKYRPKVIISTGSNIAVPLFFFGRILGSKTIYIESRAKVRSKNMTGKFVEKFSNKIYVQWPEMLDVYGKKAEYHGILV